ncbi:MULTISPECIES: porin [Paraburkholderia]|uniref:porin n=1 Tax=Paraburkholderia TaxID=1822464 RepID=UPI00224CD385|nr:MULTISPECIES: porin [Paraburkholderia]MCX4157579.1 porin [Paraburkholderia aspalathi]MDN7166983.1 porin [Paraburkholderia sp. SECH2]MDQ6395469.1 porin [Paraburkholderia aspalathi]
MRRLAISCFTLTMLSTASIAQAQSSVTLYGEIDDALAYYNNVGHASLVTMQGADLATNQWGIKGKEDLGGGFQAIFNLENGFDINTGKLRQGGREFGKNAWVGLSSTTLGTITIGRQLDPTVDLVQPFTADGYGPAFTTPGDADNNDNTFRVDNSIKYTSPTYGGLQYELMYGLGGVAGNISSQELSSAAASYTNGGLGLAVGYIFTKNDGPGGLGTADQTQNNSVTPLFGSVAFVGSRLITHVAAQYAIGLFTVNVRYSNAQWKPYASFAAFNRTETFNTGATSLDYQVTSALAVNVGYTYTRSSGASSATYNTVAAGTEYSLSKRTTVYAIGGYSHAHGTTFSADGNSVVAAGGSVGDLESSSSTPNQVAFMMGITHKF